MLADAGAQYVIVGHSERRSSYGETDELVRRKAVAGMTAGLIPIICVGETEAERRSGRAEEVVSAQLAGSVPELTGQLGVVIAYEPVWAIGTGRNATGLDAAAMAEAIRSSLADLGWTVAVPALVFSMAGR
jgi:triosephosphate isomerase